MTNIWRGTEAIQWILPVASLSGILYIIYEHWQARLRRGFSPLFSDALLLVFIGIGATSYLLDYPDSALYTGTATIFSGILVGKSARWLVGGLYARGQTQIVHYMILVGMLLSVITACGSPENVHSYFYRDIARSTGMLHDPNLFGLTMAAATVAGFGSLSALLLQARERLNRGIIESLAKRNAPIFLHIIVIILGISISARGVYASFSRGAWLATCLGLATLIFEMNAIESKSIHGGAINRTLDHIRNIFAAPRNWRALLMIGLSSLGIGALLSSGVSPDLPLQRIASIRDINDLSWRNRLDSWAGGVQIMIDNPLTGVGLDRVKSVYKRDYLPDHIRNPSAIDTNDFIVIGGAFGVIALTSFAAYIALSMALASRSTGNSTGFWTGTSPPASRPDIDSALISIIARGATITLLCGMLLNGIVFTMPLGWLFWICLEVGAIWTVEP